MSAATAAPRDPASLWSAYRRKPTTELRERLVGSYIGLVHHVAWQMQHRMPALDPGDLAGAGSLGLLHAIDRFEPDRGLAFSTYAVKCIRGAMLDDLRRRDPMPRVVRRRARRLEAVRAALAARHGRAATAGEVAAELGVSVECYWRWRDEIGTGPVDGYSGAMASDLGDQPDRNALLASPAGDGPMAESEDKAELRRALGSLPPRMQQVLGLLYLEELPAREVAGMFGVTESRISQLRKQALNRLRVALDAARRDD